MSYTHLNRYTNMLEQSRLYCCPYAKKFQATYFEGREQIQK